MSKHYKEKALLATNNKIQRAIEQSGFFKKNINRVIILSVLFSFAAPFYSSENGNSISESLGTSYSESVVFSAVVTFSLCIVGHVVWTFQDKQRIKKLIKRKEALEEELKAYD